MPLYDASGQKPGPIPPSIAELSNKKPKKKPFDKLGPAQKRIAIARDVLKQLKNGRLKAKAGQFINHLDANNHFTSNNNSAATCEVCAMGGAFIALHHLKQKSWLDTMVGMPIQPNRLEIFDALGAYFETYQLRKIEDAFETRYGAGCIHQTDGRNFFYTDGFSNDKLRLRLIMENIVVNRGRFITDQYHRNHFKSTKNAQGKVSYYTPNFVE